MFVKFKNKAKVFIKVFGWEDKSIKTCIYSVYINRIKKAFWKKSVGQLLHDENCFSSDTQWMLTSTNLLSTRTPLGTPLWSAKPGGTSKPNSKRGRHCHITWEMIVSFIQLMKVSTLKKKMENCIKAPSHASMLQRFFVLFLVDTLINWKKSFLIIEISLHFKVTPYL